MRGLRAGAAVAVAASTLALTSPPASAATGVVFEGTMEIGCFGCGTYGPDGNFASFTATGVLAGSLGTHFGWMTFTVASPPGPLCFASWTVYGSADTVGNSTASGFTIVFTGLTGEMTVPGLPAAGKVVIHSLSPLGNPCGGPVVMRFAGELVGA